jgi:hypothetical protein
MKRDSDPLEVQRFQNALRKVQRASKVELNKRLVKEKRARFEKPERDLKIKVSETLDKG